MHILKSYFSNTSKTVPLTFFKPASPAFFLVFNFMNSDTEKILQIVNDTPNVKKPMMECELHTGEKIMVSLHHNCKTLDYVELPSSAADRPENAKNARAAAAFVDGQIKAGVVELVPGARKDVEYTMNCCQIFHVFRCKPKALQIEIDGSSTMASPGDMFMVPSDTTYQLINHSTKHTALIYYTIVDYVEEQGGGAGGDAGDGGDGGGEGGEGGDGMEIVEGEE